MRPPRRAIEPWSRGDSIMTRGLAIPACRICPAAATGASAPSARSVSADSGKGCSTARRCRSSGGKSAGMRNCQPTRITKIAAIAMTRLRLSSPNIRRSLAPVSAGRALGQRRECGTADRARGRLRRGRRDCSGGGRHAAKARPAARAVPPERGHRIVRAGRLEPAARRHKGRKEKLISADQAHDQQYDRFSCLSRLSGPLRPAGRRRSAVSSPAPSRPARAPTRTKAAPRSPISASNGRVAVAARAMTT